MQNYYTPEQFSPYSIPKQNQSNQVKQQTPFDDEDNDTSKSESQIIKQPRKINIEDLFHDSLPKSNQDIPFWENYEQQPKGIINQQASNNLQQLPIQQNIIQKEILDFFDEDQEQKSQNISQSSQQIQTSYQNQLQNPQQQLPTNLETQNISSDNNPYIFNNQPNSFQKNYFQTPITIQQNKDNNLQQIFQSFEEQINTNLGVQKPLTTFQNQYQNNESLQYINEKNIIPNSNYTSQIKQQSNQMQQFTSPYNVSQQPEEIKKQSTFLNFSLDQEQVAQPKELVNNSQQDDSDLIWSNNQKPEILQTFDFNLLDINQEQNQSLAEQPNQNSNGFNNFWQTQNNNQFNANYPQTTQFSNLLGNFNQNNFALQDLTKNQQDDIIQNQDIQNPIIQNQPKSDDQKIKDEFAYWNQPKVQSESQPSQQDIEDKFNNFSSNSQTGWGDFQIFQFNNKQKEQIEEFINFEQDNNRNYEENGSKLQQSIHNSEQEVIDKQNNNQEEENSDQEKINGNIKILNEYQQENPQKNFDSYEQKQNSLSESQIIQQPLNKTQSFEFPSSIQVPTHSIRGSKEDDKELTYVEQIMELLKPKITEITQNLSNEIINNDCNQNQEAQPKLFQGILDIFQKEKRRVELDLLNQQVQIIKDIVTKYDNKTEQLQEQFIKVREERERERQKSNMSINSIELRKSLDVDQQIEESPIQNIQLQQSPEQQQYTPKTSQDKAYIPFQLIHQTQSKYLNESLISQENKEDDLIKFKTNFVFQRQLLKGLQYQDIQKFRIQCLNEKVILLETEELIVTQNEERNENKKQGYKIQLKFKNKGRKIIQNLIVCLEGKQFKNDVEANPQRIKQQYLSPGETIIQDIRFKYYDQQTVYLNCYLKYSINGNRGYWSQGQQGIQNQEAMYISQMNQYNQNNSYQHNQENKKNYQFIIGRPANKFFTYHYWTVEELNEYKMSYQSEEFELKQLEDLIIYHPWLVKIDQQTLCGKIFLRLDENDYDFVVKVCLRGEKGVIKMNQTDMDKKLCEHLLSFLSFLFVKLY